MHAVSVKEELGWKGWSRFRPDRLCVTTAAVAARRVSVALLLPSSSGPSISPVSAVRALSLSLFPFSLASFPSFTTGGQRLHRSPPPPFFLSSIGGAFSFLFLSSFFFALLVVGAVVVGVVVVFFFCFLFPRLGGRSPSHFVAIRSLHSTALRTYLCSLWDAAPTTAVFLEEKGRRRVRDTAAVWCLSCR